MSTIPVGYGQLTFWFSGSGVPTGAAVTLGFANTGGITADDAAFGGKEAFEDNLLPLLIQNTGLDEVVAKLGPNATGPSAVSASGAAGGDLSAQAPANVAYLVHKNTDFGGRRGRGRMYLPGVDETEVDQAGTVSPTKLAALVAGTGNFYDDLVTAGMTPVILHEPEQIWVLVNGRPRRQSVGAAPAPTEVVSFAVSGMVATQRRRQRR